MLQYTLVNHADGDRFITLFVPGDKAYGATRSANPNFDTILDTVLNAPAEVDAINVASVDGVPLIDLFDLGTVVERKLEDQALSAHVRVVNGDVLFDGEVIHSSLTEQIIRFLDEGDWAPLVRFLEKVRLNPEQHSQDQLYDWVDSHDLTITDSGDFVAYKGVRSDRLSDHSGHAIVDGVEFEHARIPNQDGSTVEMPREEVAHAPGVACSTGLHVGTHSYASGYGTVVLEVHVSPADVVSVPTDGRGEKVRVCRYTVVGEIGEAYTTPVRPSLDPDNYPDEEEDEYGECSDCGAEIDPSDDQCDECEFADEDESFGGHYSDEPGL